MSVLRPIADTDVPAVLTINEEFVDLLAPMDEPRLRQLMDWADHAAVIEHEDTFAGFVITMPGGTTYDSHNYAWFGAQLGDDFNYLDRVVLSPRVRRAGLGTRAYDEIEARAAELATRMALEVNLDPPNEASLAFHRRRGYDEVGRHESNGHVVSLMVKRLR